MPGTRKKLPSTVALILLLVSCQLAPVWAAPGGAVSILEGIVRNESGTPLVGAVVSLFKENWTDKPLFTVKSGRDGAFSLSDVKPGRYIISIVKSGYQPTSYSILAPLQNNPLFVILKNLSSDEQNTGNWDVATVLRSSKDRGLIFRSSPNAPEPPSGRRLLTEADKKSTGRSGQVQFTTSQPLNPLGYSVWPNPIGTGFSTRFAYVEPLGGNNSYIVTGLLTTGTDSQYRLKNIVNYHVSDKHKLQLNLSYNKAGEKARAIHDLGGVDANALENDILKTIEPIQNISVGIQDYFKIAEPLTLVYGFDIDYSKSNRKAAHISPRFQVFFNPVEDLSFRFQLNSDRVSHDQTIALPEGDLISLHTPLNIAKVNNSAFTNRVDHMEAGFSFFLGDNTNLEVSSFLDEVAGSGYPFVAILKSPETGTSPFPLVPSEMAESQGFRFNLTHSWTQAISTSVLYIYGSGAELTSAGLQKPVISDLSSQINNRYFNVLAASINARFEKTGTDLTAVYRRADGNPLSPIDAYSDFYDVTDNSLSVFVRQSIPLFETSIGKWEAIVDIRNILNQGVQVYETTSGDLILVRAPRTLRGGISFRF
ncbi:MAG TPA: TonB-dependent receptor [Acidobacteriota bacterium]|nr:TonB-dependent receptor [Acidobacteriota bacterium]HQM64749.1 TonB-dependent receptor [Acidobacteriota bacterium]